MITNKRQIGLPTENRNIVFLTKYSRVIPASANFLNIFFKEKLLINIESGNFLNKISGVNKMKDDQGNKVYGCIYLITNLLNNKKYLGYTIDFEKRKKTHIKKLNLNKHHNIYLQRAWLKYKPHNFKWGILGYCNSQKELEKTERYCIKFFNLRNNIYGYNIHEGGKGGDTWKAHPNKKELKKKYSESHKGNKLSKKSIEKRTKTRKENGVDQSWRKRESYLEKVRKNTTGKKRSRKSILKLKETAKNNSNYGMKGKNHTKETKEKISRNNKNKINFSNKQIDEILKLRSNNVTIKEIGEKFNCSNGPIRRILKEKGLI